MGILASAVLSSLLAIAVHAQQERDDGQALLERFFALHKKGELVAALDLFEPVFAHHYVDVGFRGDTWNTGEFLARLYERAGQMERGVAYLHGVYRSKVLDAAKAGESSYSKYASIEASLFDLALLARKFEVADEVLAARTARENWVGWDLDRARFHAARGETAAALDKLASYLRYPLADSRTRVLVRRDFHPLHGDERFRKLMTETTELEAARRVARLRDMREDPVTGVKPRPDVTVEAFRAAFDVFEKVTSYEQQRALSAELRASHDMILPNVERFRTDALDLLRVDKKGTAYRLGIACYLADLQDPATTRQVAAAVKDDSFVAFPEQLFRLTYAIADTDPEAARPFLLQMLQGTKAKIVLPEHAMSIGGDDLLLQVFGRVEPHYVDDLLRWADADERPRRDKAAWVLTCFGEPRLVPILVRAVEGTKDGATRMRLLQQLGALHVPEAMTALQGFAAAEGTTAEEKTAIGELVAQLRPKEPRVVADARLAITDPTMRGIFFDNLVLTNGVDVSFVDDELWATAKPADIPRLRAIRAAVFGRFSDEAIGDWDTISALVTWLRWQ